MAKEARALSDSAPVQTNDARPYLVDTTCGELGGKIRLQRLTAEQIVQIKERFESLGGLRDLVVTKHNRWAIVRLVQNSVLPPLPDGVPLHYMGLLCQGDAGYQRMWALSDETLLRLANEVIEFNGMV